MEAALHPARSDLGDRIVKVNHAGENGAIAIYTGQILLARLTAPGLVQELREFRSHELRHRAIFGDELARRKRRRCRSYWLCGLGGFILGLITGLLGSGAISATTVAVESVVLRHLEHQLVVLKRNFRQGKREIFQLSQGQGRPACGWHMVGPNISFEANGYAAAQLQR